MFTVALDIARADVFIIAFQRLHQISQRYAVGQQSIRLRRDVKFLDESAYRVDVGDTRHRAQLRLDYPILDFPQVSRCVRAAVGLDRTRLGLHRPHIDLAQPGRDRAHGRRQSRRESRGGFPHALVDQLSREVNVGAVFEHYRDLRETIT